MFHDTTIDHSSRLCVNVSSFFLKWQNPTHLPRCSRMRDPGVYTGSAQRCRIFNVTNLTDIPHIVGYMVTTRAFTTRKSHLFQTFSSAHHLIRLLMMTVELPAILWVRMFYIHDLLGCRIVSPCDYFESGPFSVWNVPAQSAFWSKISDSNRPF